MYYAGGWQSFGTTEQGLVSKELLPGEYKFRMQYEGGVNDLVEDIRINPAAVFKTVNVSISLSDHNGNPIDGGSVLYYAGGWKNFGTLIGGQVNKELLPATYKFRMQYSGGTTDLSQDVLADPMVNFSTGIVHSDSSYCSNIYANGWQPFLQDMEILPGKYTFRFSDGFPDSEYTVEAGAETIIH